MDSAPPLSRTTLATLPASNLCAPCTGMIDYEEFLAATASPARLLSQTSLLRAFEFVDRDSNGTISVKDMETVRGVACSGACHAVLSLVWPTCCPQ